LLAAWYENNGAARAVLQYGEQPDPLPGKGEVRVRLRASAVNPSDVKARGGSRPVIPPRVIPNSDGAGDIDRVADVELGVNLPQYEKALRPAAMIASYAAAAAQDAVVPSRLRQRNVTLRMVFVYTMPDGAKGGAIADIARWLASGRPKFDRRALPAQ